MKLLWFLLLLGAFVVNTCNAKKYSREEGGEGGLHRSEEAASRQLQSDPRTVKLKDPSYQPVTEQGYESTFPNEMRANHKTAYGNVDSNTVDQAVDYMMTTSTTSSTRNCIRHVADVLLPNLISKMNENPERNSVIPLTIKLNKHYNNEYKNNDQRYYYASFAGLNLDLFRGKKMLIFGDSTSRYLTRFLYVMLAYGDQNITLSQVNDITDIMRQKNQTQIFSSTNIKNQVTSVDWVEGTSASFVNRNEGTAIKWFNHFDFGSNYNVDFKHDIIVVNKG